MSRKTAQATPHRGPNAAATRRRQGLRASGAAGPHRDRRTRGTRGERQRRDLRDQVRNG